MKINTLRFIAFLLQFETISKEPFIIPIYILLYETNIYEFA